ncbi:MAG TPA: YlxR family protein [Acidothermaceae bacterium]
MRSCVGCKKRAAKSDLLRLAVVRHDEQFRVVPDPRGQRPGRGASLHPDPHCLDLAERRRAFPRAFRLAGPLDFTAVRGYIEAQPRGTRA